MSVVSCTARHIRTEGSAPAIRIYDDNTGDYLGHCDLFHGFAYFTGGGIFQGAMLVIAGGFEGLRDALAQGVRNGRDDRQSVVDAAR